MKKVMEKFYKIWFLVTILGICILAGCSYAKANGPKIPNLGLLEPISWESQDDPNGTGEMQKFIVRDTERSHDYIIVETTRGDISITARQ